MKKIKLNFKPKFPKSGQPVVVFTDAAQYYLFLNDRYEHYERRKKTVTWQKILAGLTGLPYEEENLD